MSPHYRARSSCPINKLATWRMHTQHLAHKKTILTINLLHIRSSFALPTACCFVRHTNSVRWFWCSPRLESQQCCVVPPCSCHSSVNPFFVFVFVRVLQLTSRLYDSMKHWCCRLFWHAKEIVWTHRNQFLTENFPKVVEFSFFWLSEVLRLTTTLISYDIIE